MIVAGDTSRPLWRPNNDDPGRERAALFRRCPPDAPCGGVGYRLVDVTGFDPIFTDFLRTYMSIYHPDSLAELDESLNRAAATYLIELDRIFDTSEEDTDE